MSIFFSRSHSGRWYVNNSVHHQKQTGDIHRVPGTSRTTSHSDPNMANWSLNSGFPGKKLFFICLPHLAWWLQLMKKPLVLFIHTKSLLSQSVKRSETPVHHSSPRYLSLSSELTQTSSNSCYTEPCHSLIWNFRMSLLTPSAGITWEFVNKAES